MGDNYQVDKFLFASGTVLMASDITKVKIIGTDAYDTLLGGADDENTIGGYGDDYLEGGQGDDTYIFGKRIR